MQQQPQGTAEGWVNYTSCSTVNHLNQKLGQQGSCMLGVLGHGDACGGSLLAERCLCATHGYMALVLPDVREQLRPAEGGSPGQAHINPEGGSWGRLQAPMILPGTSFLDAVPSKGEDTSARLTPALYFLLAGVSAPGPDHE